MSEKFFIYDSTLQQDVAVRIYRLSKTHVTLLRISDNVLWSMTLETFERLKNRLD